MSLIVCKDINFSYGNKSVLKNVNFQVDSGEFLSVIGENGAGKTTLIKVLLGFLKPKSGDVIMEKSINKRIGYLPQQNRIQKNFPATVEEIVISGTFNCIRTHFVSNRQKEIAYKNMSLLGIEELGSRSFKELSGGQQQKVLMARALCSTDRLIILDEPVSNLDPVATQELYEIITMINKKLGVTVIMISHDLDAALQLSDKLLLLKYENSAGSIGYFGNTEFFSAAESSFLAGRRSYR